MQSCLQLHFCCLPARILFYLTENFARCSNGLSKISFRNVPYTADLLVQKTEQGNPLQLYLYISEVSLQLSASKATRKVFQIFTYQVFITGTKEKDEIRC